MSVHLFVEIYIYIYINVFHESIKNPIITPLFGRLTHLQRPYTFTPKPLPVRYRAYFCISFIAGAAGSNPTEGMNIRLLCLLCVV